MSGRRGTNYGSCDTSTHEDQQQLTVKNLRTDSKPVSGRAVVTVVILTTVNLLNYMDRLTLAGVLKDVQKFYSIDNSQAGLLQSSFVVSYMIFCLLFGYLGDRFKRKWIMIAGVVLWSGITFASSFIGSQYFVVFLLMRALVGIGEASYSTVAPTVIADLFTDTERTVAMTAFYFAIPVGSGLGYVVGASVANLFGEWQYALRVTPFCGILCVVLTVFVIREPIRQGSQIEVTSWFSDIKYLFKHKTFVFTSLASTCATFSVGALAFWSPIYVYRTVLAARGYADDALISLVLGVMICAAGVTGIVSGSFAALRLRQFTYEADPLVCAFSLMLSAPFILLSLVFASNSVVWFYIFMANALLSFQYPLVIDILMYVVIPTRRSSAGAFQTLMQHALGDAISPYLVGLISDEIERVAGYSGNVTLQYALYIACFVCVCGAAFFLAAALFVHRDRTATETTTTVGVGL